jgi:hypothetical protein
MRLPASGAHTVTYGGALAAVTGGYGRWVLLQHVQHSIYFCNIQIKHLQHTSETAETLAKTQKKLENTCVAIANIYKHPDKTFTTYLKHLYIYATSRSTFATSK